MFNWVLNTPLEVLKKEKLWRDKMTTKVKFKLDCFQKNFPSPAKTESIIEKYTR